MANQAFLPVMERFGANILHWECQASTKSFEERRVEYVNTRNSYQLKASPSPLMGTDSPSEPLLIDEAVLIIEDLAANWGEPPDDVRAEVEGLGSRSKRYVERWRTRDRSAMEKLIEAYVLISLI